MSTQTPPDAPVDTGAATPRPSAPAKAWTVWLPILCAVATGIVWWQTRVEIASVRRTQQQLASEIAALRDLPSIDVSGAPALGRDTQVVTLVEFSDYECPFCIRHVTQTMPRIATEFIDTGRLRYVFKDFPIDQLHPGAVLAHEAARCAGEQGRFWQLHRHLFSAPGTHAAGAIDARATEAGLDMTAFRSCLGSGRMREAVQHSVSTAVALGANGTPAFFVGIRDLATDRVEIRQVISGAQPFDVFANAIAAVARAVPGAS